MYSLRKATYVDVDILVDFRIEFLKEFQNIPSDNEMEIFRKSLKNFFLDKMKSGEFIAWFAVSENKILATSGLSFLQRPPHFFNKTGKFAYIMNMYTKPNWRRKGVGSALLEKLFEEIKNKGINTVFLHATPAGRPLYEKYGFRESDGEMILKL